MPQPGQERVARSGLGVPPLLIIVFGKMTEIIDQFLVQFAGLARTTVTHASLMVGNLPVLLAAGAALFAHERITPSRWLALFASTLGAALIAFGASTGEAGAAATLAGDLLVAASLLAAVAWVLISQRLMKAGRDYSPASTSAYIITGGTVLLAIWVFATEGPPSVHLSVRTWLSVAASGLLATTVTTYTDPVTPGGAIAKHSYYDFFGNLVKADLNCCQQKTWIYSATTNYAFPDSVTSGTSAPQLTTSATYNSFTGLVATATDENGQVTNYDYTDSGHLNRLMGDLFDYGKPYSQELRAGSIYDAIVGGITVCEPLAEREQVKIVNRVPKTLALVMMDEKRLPQIFSNLIRNAIQHSCPDIMPVLVGDYYWPTHCNPLSVGKKTGSGRQSGGHGY